LRERASLQSVEENLGLPPDLLQQSNQFVISNMLSSGHEPESENNPMLRVERLFLDLAHMGMSAGAILNMFDTADESTGERDCQLSVDELHKGLINLNCDMDIEQVEEIHALLDKSGDGLIDYVEWCGKRLFLRHDFIKTISLPRQALDKNIGKAEGVFCRRQFVEQCCFKRDAPDSVRAKALDEWTSAPQASSGLLSGLSPREMNLSGTTLAVENLCVAMRSQGMKFFFSDWDISGDGLVDRREIVKGMASAVRKCCFSPHYLATNDHLPRQARDKH
jgi:hypothetical protein